MSFPRAKIKRFNDIRVATPSPADYNVDLKQKHKLGIISQQGRFADNKSPPISETGSTQSTPCFRTPTILKRRKDALGSASKPNFQNLKLSDKDLLHEKTVECKNKDTFIKELTEQLEDLKNNIYKIQCEKDTVSKEKEEFENEMLKWRDSHDAEINILLRKHETEIFDLNETISKVESDLELLKSKNEILNEEMVQLQSTKQQEITEYEKEISAKNIVIKHMQMNLDQMRENRKHLEEKHKNEIEGMREKHLAELQSIEVKTLNSIHEMQMALDEQKLQSQLKVKELENSFHNEIKSLKVSSKEEKQQILDQNALCIAQLEEKMREIKIISEIQATEKCSELENFWKSKLESKENESNAILKECQAISEYSIIQSEIEKNEYKSKFEQTTNKYNILEKKYDDVYLKYKKLQSSFSEAQNKLYRLMKEIREKEVIKNQLNQLLLEKQTYEAAISRSQDTVNILKNRLKESYHDVEQLKKEICNNEEKLLDYEYKFNMMSDELKEAQVLNEALEINNESNSKLAREEINQMKEDLISKLEKFKLIAENNKIIQKEEMRILMEEREELLQMLEQHQVLNIGSKDLLMKADKELERLTTENLGHCQKIETLECKNSDINTKLNDLMDKERNWALERKELDFKIDILKNEIKEMRKREEEWQKSCTKVKELENQCEIYKETISEKDARIIELENKVLSVNNRLNALEEVNRKNLKKIQEQNALIAPFKEQLESYELEMKNLKSAKDHIENEAKDLGQKYAEILGHQNHKQKIKYMVNLKSKNEELSKTNVDLESKLRIHEKKLEKLKKENADLKRTTKKIALYEDKENIGSPNRSFKCDSPGPLKNLN
ncbi:hyaluronan-mediated motility receptor-like [Harmonia axyridis]|uniref:hyaluronan-mediated motility receptor-like n=1 Tax=Harmonia axyridis TaxID=115357 RepID=UPI001E278AB0|nr:hyaluronan-mediated motility receptor-like [Harmonia axyridis]